MSITNKEKRILAIDGGHGIGCPNGGATGPTGITEANVVLLASWKLHDILKDEFDVHMIRPTEYHRSLSARCAHANNVGAELFLSLHCNGYNGKASGIETWYYPSSKKGKIAAQLIQEESCKEFPSSIDRGIKSSTGLAVLNRTSMPAALFEMEFIDVPEMEKRLQDPAQLDKYAQALARAIRKYFKTN